MGVEWKSRDAVIEEPGRRIVQEQTRTGGQALPWLDMTAFLRGAIDLALDNHANAPRSNTQWVFFDRGLIDAAAAPQALDGTTILDTIAQSHRYHSRIFLCRTKNAVTAWMKRGLNSSGFSAPIQRWAMRYRGCPRSEWRNALTLCWTPWLAANLPRRTLPYLTAT